MYKHISDETAVTSLQATDLFVLDRPSGATYITRKISASSVSSYFVPYTGASANVNLGAYSLSATGLTTSNEYVNTSTAANASVVVGSLASALGANKNSVYLGRDIGGVVTITGTNNLVTGNSVLPNGVGFSGWLVQGNSAGGSLVNNSDGGVLLGNGANLFGDVGLLVGIGNDVVVGQEAVAIGDGSKAGPQSVCVGYGAGSGLTVGATGNVLIGYAAGSSLTTEDNKLYISNSLRNLITGDFSAGTVYFNGDIYTNISPTKVVATDSGSKLVGLAYQSFGGSPIGNTDALVYRDSRGTFAANNFMANLASTATAVGTTTLTESSARNQVFTGTTTQNCVLPDARNLQIGWVYELFNRSTGAISVKDGASGALFTLPAGGYALVICLSTSTLAGGWDFSSLGINSVSGTTNRITVSPTTGAAIVDIAATYVGQTSITTLGTVAIGTWQGSPITLTYGGTNANLTASNGGVVYSTATAMAILSGTATANKMLLSGSSTAPTWSTSTIPSSAGATANKVLLSDGTNYVLSTPTFPNASATAGKIILSDGTNWAASTSTFADTYSVSTILYASSANTVSGLTTANSALLVTSGSGVPSLSTNIPTAVTIGGAYIYRVGGTGVAIADGGTNAASQASNGINYFDGTKITSGSGIQTNGTKFAVGSAVGADSNSLFAAATTRDSPAGNLWGVSITGATGAATTSLAKAGPLGIFPNFSNNAGSGVSIASGMYVDPGTAGGTIPVGAGIYVGAINFGTTRYGIYIDAPTGGSLNYVARFGGFRINGSGNVDQGGWTASPIGLAYGGTNANITAVNGAVAYSTASAIAFNAAPAATGKILLSANASAPTWTSNLFLQCDSGSSNADLYITNYNTRVTTNGINVFLGVNAGNATLTSTRTTVVGNNAGTALTSGSSNSFYGNICGAGMTTGGSNALYGVFIAQTSAAAAMNSSAIFGASACANGGASQAAIFGNNAGITATGVGNSLFGYFAGYGITNGTYNLCIGYQAGYGVTSGGSNVLIGYQAGKSYVTTQSNQLYICNSDTATPLIQGVFPNTSLRITATTTTAVGAFNAGSSNQFQIDSFGRVGVGGSPDTASDMYLQRGRLATSGNLWGMQIGGVFGASSGTVSYASSIYLYPNFSLNAGTISTAAGLMVGGGATAGTVTTGIGLFITAIEFGTTRYGLYVTQPTGGTNNYGSYIGGVSGFNRTPQSTVQLGITAVNTYGLYMDGTMVTANASHYALLLQTASQPTSNSYNSYCIGLQPTFTSGASGINSTNGIAISPTFGGSGTITQYSGLYIDVGSLSGASLTTSYGIYIDALAIGTTRIGLEIKSPTGGTTNIGARFSGGNVVLQSSALSTSATTGFTYIPTCAGAPSGVPTAFTGTCAMVYDTTNNKLYIYNGAWKSVTLT